MIKLCYRCTTVRVEILVKMAFRRLGHASRRHKCTCWGTCSYRGRCREVHRWLFDTVDRSILRHTCTCSDERMLHDSTSFHTRVHCKIAPCTLLDIFLKRVKVNCFFKMVLRPGKICIIFTFLKIERAEFSRFCFNLNT